MINFREKYLSNLTNAVGEILKKDTLTKQDIELLALFKAEIARYEYIPPFKQFLGNMGSLVEFLNKKILKNGQNVAKSGTQTNENDLADQFIKEEQNNGV